MRKLILILFIFVISGCTPKDYGENLDKQISKIEQYVSKYSYTKQGGVYVIIMRIGEAEATIPEFGDLITFNYLERTFVDQPLDTISTNVPELAQKAGLDTPAEYLVPKEIEWGVTPLIPGLQGALMWATKGEILQAIVPFPLGYDDKWENAVPPYSGLAFDIEILDIQKKNEN